VMLKILRLPVAITSSSLKINDFRHRSKSRYSTLRLAGTIALTVKDRMLTD
jgi:hypothetical protein